ncbi:restriction endonuclease subunit S [Micromonospora sp. B11E3]|uniref:restriction endonuclease subunit S n=1 Tax=Micromonospora sp. B11E3 TaxID=3153562 RepID=UPI00325E801E
MNDYRIKHIAKINAQTLPESTDPSYTFRYIDIGSVNSSGGISIPEREVSFAAAPSRARRLAPPGSVVVSTVRTYLRAVAPVPASGAPLVFSTGFAVLEASDRVDNRYLAYYCQSQPFIDEVVARSTGVSYPAINASEIGNLTVTLPPLEEQRRLADFLDVEIARIDRLASARRRQYVTLEEHTNAEVSEILIPGITRSPSGTWPWTWLPTLREDRALVRLGYVSRLQNGITIDGSREASIDSVTRPYLRVANVQAGYVDLSSVTEVTVPRAMAVRSTLRPGDVLMTEGGDLDKLGRGTVWEGQLPNCLHQNHVFALRPDPDRLDPHYLALMTQTLHGRCYFESTGSKTTNLASTNSSKIMSFPIPLPRLSRQRELVRQLRTQLDAATRFKARLDQQLALLNERRQALITAAVTGQIDSYTANGRGTE